NWPAQRTDMVESIQCVIKANKCHLLQGLQLVGPPRGRAWLYMPDQSKEKAAHKTTTSNVPP
uniref:Uncharacterized protein n=1 Tax=Aegilops tauschii subsp. strangulata TaxID=200361 RepID=A0A453Q4J2_AEGTS